MTYSTQAGSKAIYLSWCTHSLKFSAFTIHISKLEKPFTLPGLVKKLW